MSIKYSDLTTERKDFLEKICISLLEHVLYHYPLPPKDPGELFDRVLEILINKEHIINLVEIFFCGGIITQILDQKIANEKLAEIFSKISSSTEMIEVKVECINPNCPVHGKNNLGMSFKTSERKVH